MQSEATTASSSLRAALASHRAGRLDESAALYREALRAAPDCAVALGMLGHVEFQRRHVDEALRLIARAIEVDPSSPAHRITLGHVHRDLGDLAAAGDCYRDALALSPGSALAAMSLADALRRQDEPAQALAVLRELAAREPDHAEALRALGDLCLALALPVEAGEAFMRSLAVEANSADAWFGLGVAASQQGQAEAAGQAFGHAAALRPGFAEALYNLGVIEIERHDLAAAETWLRRAVAARPDYVEAHVNLSAILGKRGHTAEAALHCDAAYRRRCVFVHRDARAVRTVLLLFDAGQGNINLSHLFAPTRNNLVDWMIEYASPGQGDALPPFDLVFNAMGDADMAGAATAPAARFIAECTRPVLNRPEAVARTSRHRTRALLGDIDALVVPEAWRVAPGEPWPAAIAGHLPVLVRPANSHGGTGLQCVTSAAELARIEAAAAGALHVCAFFDFRSADGGYRKYRVVFIDRKPYAYHLAISSHWLVHYATADMAGQPWKLEEERRFLDDPRRALGAAAWAAIEAIGSRMDLDYAGVDFTLLADGRVLVFEANPVMLVHPEDEAGPFAFKNAAVVRILDAFEALLERTTRAARP